MSGQEVLGLMWRLEPLHLPFSASRRSVGVFSAIVEVAALSVLDVREQSTLCRAVAPELVGHAHTRNVLQTPEQALEEPRCGFRISTTLDKNVEHDPVPIYRVPEIVKLPWIRMNTSSKCHLSPGCGRRRRTLFAKLAPNLAHHRRTLSYDTTTPRSARSNSTSRKLRLNTWYSQTAWLTISAGRR